MTSPEASVVDRLGHRLAMALRGAHAYLRRQSNRAFSVFGMTTDQYVLLSVLSEEGEATQQELAARCFSDTATIAAMVGLLEGKGLLSRAPHPTDGRAWSVRVTAAGRVLTEQMRRGSASIRAELVSLFEAAEVESLIGGLERMAGAMRPAGRGAARRRARRFRAVPEEKQKPEKTRRKQSR